MQPVHVRSGFAWEDAERRAIDRLLAAPGVRRTSRRCDTLAVDMRDVYPPEHWAIAGTPPAYDTPDEDVYLEGRNIMLISKAAVLCARLRHSSASRSARSRTTRFQMPRRSSSRRWRARCPLASARDLAIVTPLAALHKDDVIRLGAELGVPMELSMSCMNPQEGVHCGACSKCRERRDAFAAAGVPDRTAYAVEWTRQ